MSVVVGEENECVLIGDDRDVFILSEIDYSVNVNISIAEGVLSEMMLNFDEDDNVV